jgi:integrase
MNPHEGNLLGLLTGGTRLKQRVQHPDVIERNDRGKYYWYFRYREDVIQPDGSVKTFRRFHKIGPSRDKANPISHKKACQMRDEFLADLDKPKPANASPGPEPEPPEKPEPAQKIFGDLAALWRRDYVEKKAAGKFLLAKPTREKYANAMDNHILRRWKDARLADLRAKAVQDWLQEEADSWHMMSDLRGVMSGVITKAIEWEIIPETFANPMQRVKLPKKWEVREKRNLTAEQTAWVLSKLDEAGNLLISETCLDTGTRISEVTGLMIKHVDLEKGTIGIAQRNWRGDIDAPKTPKSRRILALGALTERYKAWIEKLPNKGPNAWVFPGDDPAQPRWDSGVRQALKRAARACKAPNATKEDLGLDFPGFGPHSLRRANITWRQEVGSSLEASIIAGHSDLRTTQEYTLVPLKRQEELTRHVQAKRAGEKVVEMKSKEAAA